MTAISPRPTAERDTPAEPKPRTRRTVGAVVRSIFFWIHLVVGITGGLVIGLMSVTGVMLAYERQTIAWIDGVPKVAQQPDHERKPLEVLVAESGAPLSSITGITLNRKPDVPVTLRLKDRSTKLLNPYTGAALESPPEGKARQFMTWLRGWHRWLGTKAGAARDKARAVTGAFNLAFLFLVLSGLYLWWPRRWTRSALRNVTLFRGGLSSKARDFNWHNVIGFWSAIPLAIVVITGAFISYRWPGLWLDRLLGNEKERATAIETLNKPPASPGERPAAGGPEDNPARPEAEVVEPTYANLDLMVGRAVAQDPEWRTIALTFPEGKDTTIRMSIAAGNTYRPDLRTQLAVRSTTGDLVSLSTYDSLSTARKLRSWVRFGHTGEVFGWFGQTVAMLVSLGGVVLVWTGFALGFRRIRGMIKPA